MKVVVAVLLGVVVLAGCGGSRTTYDGGAFKSCLEEGGATIVALPHRPVVVFEHLPGGFGAQFPSGEVVLGYVAKDESAAKDAANWLEQLPSAKNGKIDRKGNLVVGTFRHPTTGVVRLLASCEKAAAKT